MTLEFKELKANKSSISILNDKELLDLQKSFQQAVLPSVEIMWDILDKIKVDSTSDTAPKDRLIALAHISTDAHEIIIKMKIRLDELAKTIK